MRQPNFIIFLTDDQGYGDLALKRAGKTNGCHAGGESLGIDFRVMAQE